MPGTCVYDGVLGGRTVRSTTLLLLAVLPASPPTMSHDPGPTARRDVAIVAHRGASADAPENTLAAFRLGFEQGAHAVEGDFRMTRDGTVVAMHDETLTRTTGDHRSLSEVADEELAALSVGNWGEWRGRGFDSERAPTLADALSIVPAERGFLIEVKDGPEIVRPILEVLESTTVTADRITIIAFEPEVVAEFKRAAPERRVLLLRGFRRIEERWRPTVEEIVELAGRIGADGVGVHANPDVVDERFVETVRKGGLEMHVWTVNDPALATRMRSIGVDSITTDRPAAIRAGAVDASTAEGDDRGGLDPDV